MSSTMRTTFPLTPGAVMRVPSGRLVVDQDQQGFLLLLDIWAGEQTGQMASRINTERHQAWMRVNTRPEPGARLTIREVTPGGRPVKHFRVIGVARIESAPNAVHMPATL